MVGVRFSAEVGRSEDDETFAFAKRPRCAEELAGARPAGGLGAASRGFG